MEAQKGTGPNLNILCVFRNVFLHEVIPEMMAKLVELIQRKRGLWRKGDEKESHCRQIDIEAIRLHL